MTKLLIMFVVLTSGLGAGSLAQTTDVINQTFPFAQYNDPKLSLTNKVSDPDGFTRMATSSLTPFQLWLANLPLMPRESYPTDWQGNKIADPDTTNGILDLKVDSKYFTDADLPVFLLMNYFYTRGKLAKFPIRLSKTLTVTYQDWLGGKYIDNGAQGLYYQDDGVDRPDNREEFNNFVHFVMKYFDTKTLRLNVEHTDARAPEGSHMFIQYILDDPDSVGHTAVILDAALGGTMGRKVLVAYGGNPAQSIIVPNIGLTIESRWMSIDELREYLKEYGQGYLYRWLNG